MPGHVLVVDDEPSIRKVLATQLRRDGHTVHLAASGDEAITQVADVDIDLVLTDLRMPGLDGMGLLRWMRDTRPEVPVVVLTAHGTVDTAVEAIKRGAVEFLTKPFDQAALRQTVAEALATGMPRRHHVARDTPLELLGDGAAVRAVRDVLARVADTPAPVLVRGERGTGREVVARAIHDGSSRRDGPFLVVHLGALEAERQSAVLFGETTPAGELRPGRLMLSDGGTLLLDGVESLAPDAQSRLLRLLQDGTCEPVDGVPRAVDCRVVATTEVDLDDAHAPLQEALHYRLTVLPLHLPPLRTRLEDLPTLARQLLARAHTRLGTTATDLTDEALARLASHAWPGNLRELETVLERAALLADGPILDEEDLVGFRPRIPSPDGDGMIEPPTPEESALDLKAWLKQHLTRLERQRIAVALAEEDHNVTHAARRLGISRRSLQTKMKEYGLRER